jgi:methoxymalonate biosynthesis acyl carrier protein
MLACMVEKVAKVFIPISNHSQAVNKGGHMTAEDIKAKTRTFMAKHFQNHDLQDDDDIFALGFVNSLFAMQLVLFVEREFGMTVEDEDLRVDNFNTVNAIAHLVRRKSM